MMKAAKIILLVALVVLSGCATAIKYNYDYAPNNEKLVFEILDMRPQEEKEAEVMSMLITSDQYGIYRIGDEQLVPDRVLYLSEKISEKAADRFRGKVVKISHFEIFNNQQKALRRGIVAASLGGLVGAAIDASINPNADAFIQIKLQLDTEDQSYSAHVVKGYTIDKWKGISKEQLANEIRQAMDLAIDNILEKMQKA